MARGGLVQSQEPRISSKSPMSVPEPRQFDSPPLFSQTVTGSWIGTGAHVWYQHQRWQLYLPHHSTDSVAIHFFFLIWWVNMWPKWANTLGITLDTYILSLGLVIRQVKMTSSFGPTGIFTITMSYEQHSLYLYNRMLDSLPLPIPAMSGYTLT